MVEHLLQKNRIFFLFFQTFASAKQKPYIFHLSLFFVSWFSHCCKIAIHHLSVCVMSRFNVGCIFFFGTIRQQQKKTLHIQRENTFAHWTLSTLVYCMQSTVKTTTNPLKIHVYAGICVLESA